MNGTGEEWWLFSAGRAPKSIPPQHQLGQGLSVMMKTWVSFIPVAFEEGMARDCVLTAVQRTSFPCAGLYEALPLQLLSRDLQDRQLTWTNSMQA